MTFVGSQIIIVLNIYILISRKWLGEIPHAGYGGINVATFICFAFELGKFSGI
jgi:hypothetical protein